MNPATTASLRLPIPSDDLTSSPGPWSLSPLPPVLSTTQNYTLTFHCHYHASDLCPPRYAIFLRGPTLFSPDPKTFTVSEDGRAVSIEINVKDPGEYKLFAWPDFKDCPAWWRKNMKYPFNRAQVSGTPLSLVVEGPTAEKESFDECNLTNPELLGESNGRWVHRASLLPSHQSSPWTTTWPNKTEYLYAPYSCKRTYLSPRAILAESTSITHIAFFGDSTTRGPFCRFIYPSLSTSGLSDGNCTFEDNHSTYYSLPKSLIHTTTGDDSTPPRNITLSYRFLNNGITTAVPGLNQSLPSPPSHIVTNAGLWLSNSPPSEYRASVTAYLEQLYEYFPSATVIWRTTTDLAPMVACYAEKHMDREVVSFQGEVGVSVVEEMRRRGMRIFVVDAGRISRGRPEASLDGRHWVREDPRAEAVERLERERKDVGEGEKQIIQAIWEVLKRDDEWRRGNPEMVKEMGAKAKQEVKEGEGEVKETENVAKNDSDAAGTADPNGRIYRR